jgi:polysaccharide biosynthesis protein PslG
LLNGIPLSIWYDWKNDGRDPDDGEQNFGTVTDDLQPKPAYAGISVELGPLPQYIV